MKNIALILKKNIITENPLLVRFLGLSAALVVTEDLPAAIAMGVAVTAVLLLSDAVLSLLIRIIPEQVRLAAYVLVVCGFVTAAELILAAYFPAERDAIGIFLPLAAVSCLVTSDVKKAVEADILTAVVDGLSTGAGYLLALVLLALLRLGISQLFGGEGAFPALSFIILAAASAGYSKLISVFGSNKRLASDKADAVAEAEQAQIQVAELDRAEENE